jgi:hypothetical protein
MLTNFGMRKQEKLLCNPKVELKGQEPLLPAVWRNPPNLQSSFANRRRLGYGGQEASEDTLIPPRPEGCGFLRRRVNEKP